MLINTEQLFILILVCLLAIGFHNLFKDSDKD